ncbi:NACHT domain-containing protein, partial [Psychrobacter sp. MES7-P7E]
ICPLQNNQIMAIVQSYYKPGKNVRSDISNLQLFNMLPKTPMTAILLGQILSHDPKEIPSTLTELYSKFTEIVLFRWSGDNLQSQTEYEIFKNVCGIFSKYLLDYNLTTVSMGELKEIIDEYLSERNLDIDKNKIFEKLAYNNEIFITNYKANTIRFKHRSFCEFFYARALFQNKSYKMNKEIYNPYWQNAYFFVFGLIKDSSNLITSLSEIEFDSYGLKINQVATNAQFLLAAYVSPYTAIENQLDHSINIAANTVLEILNDPAEAETLKSLDMGRIELMIFMCIVISQCYSYDFFDKALRNIGDTITGDTKEFSDTDWLKLLFISATLAVKGDSQYIDIITKNYVEKKMYLDNDQLSILLNLIYSNNFEINSSTRQFLKLYRRRVPKSSNLNKTIDLLSKGKREDARIFNNSNR